MTNNNEWAERKAESIVLEHNKYSKQPVYGQSASDLEKAITKALIEAGKKSKVRLPDDITLWNIVAKKLLSEHRDNNENALREFYNEFTQEITRINAIEGDE